MVTSTLNGKKIAYINDEWIDSDGKRIDDLNKPLTLEERVKILEDKVKVLESDESVDRMVEELKKSNKINNGYGTSR